MIDFVCALVGVDVLQRVPHTCNLSRRKLIMDNVCQDFEINKWLEEEYNLRVLDVRWEDIKTKSPPYQLVGRAVAITAQFTEEQMRTVLEKLRGKPIVNLAIEINLEAKSRLLIAPSVGAGTGNLSPRNIFTITMNTLSEVKLLFDRIL